MNYHLIWQAALVIVVGTMLLRVAGRKAISQMTLAQTILMISIGTLLIQPIANKSVWFTFILASVLVITVIILEYGQLKFEGLERLITGKALVLIENGQINRKNLMKTRMTVDQLEMKLRLNNITNIDDVQFATLEASGLLGYTLKPEHQPATKQDLLALQQAIENLAKNQPIQSQFPFNQPGQDNLFIKIQNEENSNPPPNYLQ